MWSCLPCFSVSRCLLSSVGTFRSLWPPTVILSWKLSVLVVMLVLKNTKIWSLQLPCDLVLKRAQNHLPRMDLTLTTEAGWHLITRGLYQASWLPHKEVRPAYPSANQSWHLGLSILHSCWLIQSKPNLQVHFIPKARSSAFSTMKHGIRY